MSSHASGSDPYLNPYLAAAIQAEVSRQLDERAAGRSAAEATPTQRFTEKWTRSRARRAQHIERYLNQDLLCDEHALKDRPKLLGAEVRLAVEPVELELLCRLDLFEGAEGHITVHFHELERTAVQR